MQNNAVTSSDTNRFRAKVTLQDGTKIDVQVPSLESLIQRLKNRQNSVMNLDK